MNVEREVERLAAVYAENSDEQLLAMYDRREDLTDVAQEALAQVMKARGVVPKSTVAHSPADSVVALEERAEELQDPLDPDEVCVWNFDDVFQLQEALRILDNTGIEQRVVNWNEFARPNSVTRPTYLGLVVWREDLERAKGILQEKLALFPPQEPEETFEYVLGFVPLGEFSRADAKAIADALGEGGFSYVWDDEMENSNVSSRSVSISVKGKREAKARDWLEEKLGRLPYEAED